MTCFAIWPSMRPCRRAGSGRSSSRRKKPDFFGQYGPEARAILEELLEKYSEHGTAQFEMPEVLKVPPISEHGNVREIIGIFGGAERLKEAVDQLQVLLYAA